MKKILIVGSTSAVGLSVGRLLSQNNEVFYAGRKQTDFYLDLASASFQLPENSQFDVVVHAAADFGGNEDKDVRRVELVNAIGTLGVCQMALEVQATQLIIISSSSACYLQTDPYFGIYSLSKRHAEELAEFYCNKHDLALTILRPTQLYDSASLCRAHQRLFYSIVDRAEKGEEIVFHGSNDALRNLIFLDDFSEIVARIIDRRLSGVFNCSSIDSVRLSEIANTANRVFNHEAKVRFMKGEPDIPDLPAIESSRLFEEIGFKPVFSLDDGIQRIREVRDKL